MKVVDMHCDSITEIFYGSRQELALDNKLSLRENPYHLDLVKMEKGDYLLQNFAIFMNIKKQENPYEYSMEIIDYFHRQMEENKDKIALVGTYDDIERNITDGKMSALLTLEEGSITNLSLAHLRNFYRLGVRMITLTWNYENGIGHPNFLWEEGKVPDFKVPNTTKGLTDFGIEFAQEMEKLGMIIDVSHLSDAGFYDVLKYTKKPFVASHSNARSVCNHVRNLSDDMIARISNRGGVIGINYCPSFLKENMTMEDEKNSISWIVDHIKHIIKVGGSECVGLGSDFDGIPTNQGIKDATYLPLLADALKEEGLGNSMIEAIFSKNVLRVYKEVL